MNPAPPADAPAAVLQCPYPGCPGMVPEGQSDELILCPTCNRVSARCPRLGRRGRCATLNRCLARYCRQCRQELGPGWAAAQWAGDTGSRHGAQRPQRATPLKLDPPLQHPERVRPVFCLDEHLPFERWDYRPLGLAEAGGWLWISGPDGRYLFVDPFHDLSRQEPLVSEQLWPGASRVRLRARVSGVWLLAYAEHGIKAVNLLGLDDPLRDDHRPIDLWEAEAGEHLLAPPVLLRDSRNGLERVAVWLTGGGQQPTLWVAPLLVTHGRLPAARRFTPDAGSVSPLLTDETDRCALVEAPLPDRDALLLAAPQGLWLLDPAPAARKAPVEPAGPVGRLDRSGGADPQAPAPRRPLPAITLLDRRELLIGVHEIPGVVFVPAAKSSEEAFGTAFVAVGGDREELCAIQVAAHGAVHHFGYHDHGGLPLDPVTVRGRRQVLCRAGRSLVLCDLLGQQTRVATSDLLPWAMRVHTCGRVAICSGRDAGEGRGRWFVQLLDLEEEHGVIDQVVWDHLPAHPVLVGRYLFAVEPFSVQGRPTLWLTRRQLA
ncbi:MAG: hypothetical protein L0Z62_26280 [Gemmataceae bacterium]|nr:hypothetical protein [Gemmataceae bacterium]